MPTCAVASTRPGGSFDLAGKETELAELRQRAADPDLWNDLREVLPLLAQKQYYETLEHGYARGSEPVQFVNRVRNYEDILKRTVE